MQESVDMDSDFLEMYDQFFDDVFRYVYVKTANKWDTEDIVSEVFRKVYEKIPQAHEIQNQKAWLFTIARNCVVDHYRKKKGIPIGESLELYMTPVPFKDPLENADELDCLKKSLMQIPKEELEIINLRYLAKLQFKEVAQLLKGNDSALRVKTMRITKKLRILMNKCLGEA